MLARRGAGELSRVCPHLSDPATPLRATTVSDGWRTEAVPNTIEKPLKRARASTPSYWEDSVLENTDILMQNTDYHPHYKTTFLFRLFCRAASAALLMCMTAFTIDTSSSEKQ